MMQQFNVIAIKFHCNSNNNNSWTSSYLPSSSSWKNTQALAIIEL